MTMCPVDNATLPTLPDPGNGKVADDAVLADACAKLKLLKVTSMAWPQPLTKALSPELSVSALSKALSPELSVSASAPLATAA